MSDKPMFFFAGVYDDVSDASADYETIKALREADDLGSYDAVIIRKQADGKIKIHKTEKPTQHGAWTGLAAGAATAVVFPFLLPALTVGGMAATGAGLGAWIGHLAHGTDRGDAKEIGAMLQDGDAALIVVGVDKDAARVEQFASRAKKKVTKRIHGDFEEAEREAVAAIEQA
ncbi:MAG TPA: DUF1269 domain-containing protein [Solirubrobacteraceae bacterium]|jgi:uncharacterized membrane protein